VAGQDTPAPLIALFVLKGGYQFFTNLLGYIKAHVHNTPTHRYQIQVDFIRLKSYHVSQYQMVITVN
jgi:hypoxanthine-guanine phosphoribosyltransferase